MHVVDITIYILYIFIFVYRHILVFTFVLFTDLFECHVFSTGQGNVCDMLRSCLESLASVF